jgi:hypothetical protein
MSVRVCECVSCECIFCFSPARNMASMPVRNLIKEGSRHDLVVREAVKLRTQFGRIA